MEVRITKTRVAMAALFVLAGVGLGSLLSPLVGTALATAGQVVNISDRSGSAFFAKVSSDGKLAVGDGAGPLSVDGTVSSRPAAPASPWVSAGSSTGFRPDHRRAEPSPINLTSLSISTEASTGATLRFAHRYYVPSNATSCNGASFDVVIWQPLDTGDGVTPVSFTFPTPLQYKPPANTKACLTFRAYDATGTLTVADERRRLLRRVTTRDRAGVPGSCAPARQVLPPALGRDLPAQRLQLRTHLRDHG